MDTDRHLFNDVMSIVIVILMALGMAYAMATLLL